MVVVDSVILIASLTGGGVKAREVFTNSFYNLAKLRYEIVVLMAEAWRDGRVELQELIIEKGISAR